MATATIRPDENTLYPSGYLYSTGTSPAGNTVSATIGATDSGLPDRCFGWTGGSSGSMLSSAYATLQNTPSDFTTANSAQCRIKCRTLGWTNDVFSLTAQLLKSDYTTPLTSATLVRGSGTHATGWTDATITVSMTGVVTTATKGDWDGARFKIDWAVTGNMGADGGACFVDAVYFDIDYTPLVTTQEGFRWRNDDGSQTTATWIAAQDTNIPLATEQAAQLRVLIDPSHPPLPARPTLHYKKSTDSTWLPVPLEGTRTIGCTSIGATTQTFINTNACHGFRRTSTKTIVAYQGDVVTEMACYGEGTGQTRMAIYTVNAAGTPTTKVGTDITVNIGASAAWYTTACNIALTAGVEYTICRDLWVDQDWIGYYHANPGGSHMMSNTSATSLAATWADASSTNALSSFYATVTNNTAPVVVAASSNIAAGGEPTTAQLVAPSGKTTADFSVGRMWDDRNGEPVRMDDWTSEHGRRAGRLVRRL